MRAAASTLDRPVARRAEPATRTRTRQRPRRLASRIALIVVCLAWSVPTLGLLVSSVRTPRAVDTSGWWTVFSFHTPHLTLSNYATVLQGGMGRSLLNSFAVAIPATICPLLVAAFAAYAFAWMPLPGKNLLFAVFIALMVVPAQATLIPLLRLFDSLGLTGTFISVWIVHAGSGLPLAVFLLRNYMRGVPGEIIESAQVDGASHFTIFWRLALPLSAPALAAFATFQFLWVWNDFLIALVFLGGAPNVQVVTLTLQNLIGSRGEDWYVLTAGAFITMIVPMIVFFSLQRFFVRGLTAGAGK